MVLVICTRKYTKSEEYPWRTWQRINHPVQIILRLVAVLSLLADPVWAYWSGPKARALDRDKIAVLQATQFIRGTWDTVGFLNLSSPCRSYHLSNCTRIIWYWSHSACFPQAKDDLEELSRLVPTEGWDPCVKLPGEIGKEHSPCCFSARSLLRRWIYRIIALQLGGRGWWRLQGGKWAEDSIEGGMDEVPPCRKRVPMATGEEGARHREASSR